MITKINMILDNDRLKKFDEYYNRIYSDIKDSTHRLFCQQLYQKAVADNPYCDGVKIDVFNYLHERVGMYRGNGEHDKLQAIWTVIHHLGAKWDYMSLFLRTYGPLGISKPKGRLPRKLDGVYGG